MGDPGANLDELQAAAAKRVRFEEIVRQIADDDPDGQQALFQMFGRGLGFYFSQQFQPQEVQDRVHDTLVAVVVAIRKSQLKEPERLPGFVRTIAQRLAASHVAELVRQRAASADLSAIHNMPYTALDPEQELIRRQQRQLAEKLLNALSPIDRQILWRFYIEGETAQRICRQLGLTETQFRLRKNRAKERFAELASNLLKRRRPAGKLLLRKQAACGH